MNNLNINSQLGYYLAGLIEGDGNIWTSKELRSKSGRIHNPQIIFTFHKKELPLFKHLKDLFNSGSLYVVKDTNVGKYRISETKVLINLINLINGKFRTPKLYYLYRAIDHINIVHDANIIKLPLDTSNLADNAWLAGMTDADGNFHISLEGVYGLNGSTVRGRVKCTFSIAQRLIDKATALSCEPFMREIADLFECNINYKSNAITFLAQSDSKHFLTKYYFDNYPLMTSKHLNYLSFLQGLNFLGKRLTDKEIVKIRNIKNSMNNKRTYYSWYHLNNFYV